MIVNYKKIVMSVIFLVGASSALAISKPKINLTDSCPSNKDIQNLSKKLHFYTQGQQDPGFYDFTSDQESNDDTYLTVDVYIPTAVAKSPAAALPLAQDLVNKVTNPLRSASNPPEYICTYASSSSVKVNQAYKPFHEANAADGAIVMGVVLSVSKSK